MQGGAEPSIIQSNSFCADIFRNLPCLILFCDHQGKIVFCSEQVEKFLGFLPSSVNHLPGFPESWEAEKGFCFESKINDLAYKVTYQPLICSKNGTVKGGLISFKEKKPETVSVFIKEKSDALNILTKGIAHDFANLLSVVQGNLELAKRATDLKEKERFLKKATRALYRAREFSEALISGQSYKHYKIRDVLQEIVDIVLNHAGIKWVLNVPQDLWPLDIDQIQFTQIFLNLIKNAKEAMPLGGHLILEAENIFISEKEKGLVPGPYVKFVLIDSGHGIPPEDIPLIFKFSYSSKGKGRGYGLAIVKSIVDNHGGKIEVESVLGEGTTFTIYLPAKPGKDFVLEEKATDVSTNYELHVYMAENKRILIIDDDQDLLETLKEMLKTIGYEPQTEKDPAQALKLYEKAFLLGEPFYAVILDYNLKDTTGLELLTRIKETNPSAKVIIITGSRDEELEQNLKRAGAKEILLKPFSMENLLSALAAPNKFG